MRHLNNATPTFEKAPVIVARVSDDPKPTTTYCSECLTPLSPVEIGFCGSCEQRLGLFV